MAISRHRLFWWIICALAAGLLYLNAKAYPNISSCWFKQRFGFKCPGCGSQRAIEAIIFDRDLLSAWSYHPLVVLVLGLILVYALSLLVNAESTQQFASSVLNKSWFKWMVLGTVVGYMVLRNY